MAKAPVPGEVKTRLVPPLTAEQAADLSRALLLDQLDHLTALRSADLYLVFAPADAAAAVKTLAPGRYQCFPQRGDDLGSRMENVLAELWRRGHRNVLLIGGDLPPVPLETLYDAFAQLSADQSRVVLGPSLDGGYYLVGMNQPVPEIFSGMTWSHDQVFNETIRRLDRLGIDCALLPEWFDVDGAADLERLRAVSDPSLRAAMKRTLACL
jgi:rSAM/selenodomain-associated transferase 1